MNNILARADPSGRVQPRWVNGHRYAWDEEKHPRRPKGDERGGEFATGGDVETALTEFHKLPGVQFDPGAFEQERTLRRLAIWVRHEIDLHQEGERDKPLTRSQFRRLYDWLKRWQPGMLRTLDSQNYSQWDESKHPRSPTGSILAYADVAGSVYAVEDSSTRQVVSEKPPLTDAQFETLLKRYAEWDEER